MRIPLSWLAEFVDVAVEPQKLADDLTLIGLAVDGIERDGPETIFDLDITSNRVDCMNVYGVARELSVLYRLPLRPLALELTESGPPAEAALDVRIESPDLCPRFSARVLDVRLGPSPAWLRDRLERVGIRPIHNVVDLTNYVMMEMGHPSHAFDLARVPGARLIARWGRPGESLTTLDGVERRLPDTPAVGVVACSGGPLALAGVMGGASSEVGADTQTVALEAAYWNPLAVRRAARALGMHTEASHRFERGADPEATARATTRIAHLLQRIGAGHARPGVIDRLAAPLAPRAAPLRRHRVSLVLGTAVPEQRADAILTGLGFKVASHPAGRLEVGVPSWRGDVSREIDLIEEIGRHFGVNNVPATLPQGASAGGLKPWQVRERRVRDLLQGAGLDEVITLSFLPELPGWAGDGDAVRLANPLAEDQALLRRSLLAPGLLSSLRANERLGRRNVRLFEIGRVFLPAQPFPREERRLGILLAGDARDGHWSERGRPADLYDLGGLLDTLMERLDLCAFERVREGAPAFLHPGKSAVLRLEKAVAGWLGELHPALAERAELKGEVYAAEVDLAPLLNSRPAAVRMEPLPRQPAVDRDVSVVCDAAAEAASFVSRARAAGGALLRAVTLADRYQGPPVPPGRVSLTLSLRYQDPARTLTSEEVDANVAGVVEALRAAGAEIRGE